MTENPYVHHVPTLTGGRGYNGVYNFYKNHFVGKMPKDFKVTRISRTVGIDQVAKANIRKRDRTFEMKIRQI
jgi:carboxymethylenebutenolidase